MLKQRLAYRREDTSHGATSLLFRNFARARVSSPAPQSSSPKLETTHGQFCMYQREGVIEYDVSKTREDELILSCSKKNLVLLQVSLQILQMLNLSSEFWPFAVSGPQVMKHFILRRRTSTCFKNIPKKDKAGRKIPPVHQ